MSYSCSYGELGSVIIHQALYNMFPLTTIDPALVDPLTPNEFVQRILVPEVGMRLVLQDMDLNVEDQAHKTRAVDILHKSASYGVAMFPDGGGEWKENDDTDEEVMGVADLIVMERARKRRMEIEIEEHEEDELWWLQEEKEEAERKRQKKAETAKAKRRAARKGKEKDADRVVVDQATATRPTAPRPRPRPVPKYKAKAVPSVDSTDGMDTNSSDPKPSNTNSDMYAPTSQAVQSGSRPLTRSQGKLNRSV